jgi:glycosyltransferase involved in cell wall biosynthesis
MLKIAFFGPLPPTRSGISDYDDELLPLLRQHYDIDVFIDGTSVESGVYHHREFYERHLHHPYDLNLYQIGNSLLHEYMYGYLFQHPGAVVFHDYSLHHSRAKMLLLKGLVEEYLAEVKACYPDNDRLVQTIYGGLAGDLLLYFYPFVELILRSSYAAASHTDYSAAQLRGTETPVIKIPMAVQIEQQIQTDEKLFADRFVLASFGLITPAKRISTVLDVLRELIKTYPNLLYLLAGEVASEYELPSEIEKFGLQSHVQITGHVDRFLFHRYMARSDIVLNLRYPTAGEMSATLLRAMSYGKPVLITRLRQLQEFPAGSVIRIRPDDHEWLDLFHNLWPLIENQSLRQRIGDRAKQYIEAEHRPEQMVEKYQEFIDAALLRKKDFQRPELPLHLRSSREIMNAYMERTVFGGKESDLMEWIE